MGNIVIVYCHLTIIRRISVVESSVGASSVHRPCMGSLLFQLNFDFRENRLHDSVQTPGLCLPETNGVHSPLSLYACIQLLKLNHF